MGTTQGAGSVTAVPTYIMWLMAAIPMAEATANIKNITENYFLSHFAKNRKSDTNFLVVKIRVVPDCTVM